MKTAIIRNTILLVLLSFLGFACGDNVTDPDPDPGAEPAVVQGRVADEDPDDNNTMEGWVITASEVQSDGSLQPIGDVEAETDAEGEFTLEIGSEAAANAPDHIVLRATRDNEERKTFLTSELESGTTVYAKPLDAESTGEATLFANVVANGDDDMVAEADIESHIGPVSSGELASEQIATSASTAIATSADATLRSFESQEIDFTETMNTEVDDARAEAQVQLESDLYNNPDEQEEAYESYQNALAESYITAGVSESGFAQSRTVSSVMMMKNTTELSDESNAEIRANNYSAVAIGVDRAVQVRLEELNVSESSVSEADAAGVTLRNEIRAGGTATESEVESAFTTYNSAIEQILQDEFPANAEAIAGANAEVQSEGGLRTTLDDEVDATNDSRLVADAYAEYQASVTSAVNTQLMGATEAELEAIADILVLINLAN